MIDYKVAWDSEPGYDYTYVQYATKGSCDSLVSVDLVPSADWVELYAFDYVGAEIHHDTIPAGHAGSIKIRFQFTSDGAWSDQDGLWDTDGAIIIDSLTVRDELLGVPQTTYDYEDFEDEAWGDQQTLDGDWECCLLTGFGDYAGLYPGTTLLQEDPCNYNPTLCGRSSKGPPRPTPAVATLSKELFRKRTNVASSFRTKSGHRRFPGWVAVPLRT
jgi:hypothetical protein